ncbi:MAG TPA: DUF1049 domain-containing protein [Firmicutes bacterium]|nr:DUF1049 domain-containing protein [Bacillota bacterium]
MFWVLLLMLCALLGAVFAIQNQTVVPAINFLFLKQTDVPLVFIILGSAVLGALIVAFLWAWRQIRHSMRIWDYRGQLRRMEMDLKKARDRASELERENARLQEQTDVLLGELSQLRGGESGETG